MSNITLTIPNDDHIALRAFGKALEEMALAHGAEPRKTTIGELSYKLHIDRSEATAALERLNTATDELMQAAPCMMQEVRFDGEELQGKRKDPEIDTTAQGIESLTKIVPGATHVMTEQKLVGEPVPVGGGYSQAYTAKLEEIANAVDSTGTPWDERIHSASKALNADGTWRLRRKPKDMDEAEWAALVESVKVELLNKENKDFEEWEKTKQPDYLEPPVTPPGDDFHTDAGVVTEQTVAGIPPIPVPPPVVVAPPVADDTAWDFPKLMKFLTERHGKIDVTTVNSLLAADGITSLQELNGNPDKIGPFVARVKAHLGE